MVNITLAQASEGQTAFTIAEDVVVVIVSEETVSQESFNSVLGAASTVIREDFSGKSKQTYVLPRGSGSFAAKRLVLVGAGAEADFSAETARGLGQTIASKLKELKSKNSTVAFGSASVESHVAVIAGAIATNEYHFDRYMNEDKPHRVESISVVVSTAEQYQQSFNSAMTLAAAVIYTRDIGNERADVAHPAFFEERAKELAATHGMKLTVLQFEELQAKGLDLLVAVGQGATVLPRLIILEYTGNESSADRVGFVGKGITFDTGGLNMKGTGFIESMYMDKCGAATVLGVAKATAELKLPVNAVFALACAENAVDAKAFKPSAIIKSYKGLTVEIGNTDAEGRLVLCDGLSYVQKNFAGINTIFDIATLTGAIVIALGEYATGLFSNNDALASQVQAAGKEHAEHLWRMPIFEGHSKEVKGKQSDLKNMGAGRYGGACTAAAYLQYFIEKDVNWCHLDIAGSGMAGGVSTGNPVATLVEFLRRKSAGSL